MRGPWSASTPKKMYAGAPSTVPVQILHQPEVVPLHDAETGDDHAAGFEVPVDRPGGVRFRQRPTHTAGTGA